MLSSHGLPVIPVKTLLLSTLCEWIFLWSYVFGNLALKIRELYCAGIAVPHSAVFAILLTVSYITKHLFADWFSASILLWTPFYYLGTTIHPTVFPRTLTGYRWFVLVNYHLSLSEHHSICGSAIYYTCPLFSLYPQDCFTIAVSSPAVAWHFFFISIFATAVACIF